MTKVIAACIVMTELVCINICVYHANILSNQSNNTMERTQQILIHDVMKDIIFYPGRT